MQVKMVWEVFDSGGHVICYESRNLKEHENNDVVRDIELTAIIYALKIWRHYLVGKRFLLLTDDIGLKYLFDQKTLNARQARWIAFMSKCYFEIIHIKGKENIVADALSRQQHKLHIVLFSGYESEFKNLLKTISSSDFEYNKLMEKMYLHI